MFYCNNLLICLRFVLFYFVNFVTLELQADDFGGEAEFEVKGRHEQTEELVPSIFPDNKFKFSPTKHDKIIFFDFHCQLYFCFLSLTMCELVNLGRNFLMRGMQPRMRWSHISSSKSKNIYNVYERQKYNEFIHSLRYSNESNSASPEKIKQGSILKKLF